MDFKALEKKVQVPGNYCLRISDIHDLSELALERSISEALHLAFLAGWQKCENKRKNDARREGKQDLKAAYQAIKENRKKD